MGCDTFPAIFFKIDVVFQGGSMTFALEIWKGKYEFRNQRCFGEWALGQTI